MSLYDRVRYRLSLKWICFYFWAYRKLFSPGAVVVPTAAKKLDKTRVDITYSP
ncbi:MAG TPA: hypothetical protein VLY20_09725 [Nitrospiria bacterium]|nr:hypothetical protein [Nitrospiria bacterium]